MRVFSVFWPNSPPGIPKSTCFYGPAGVRGAESALCLRVAEIAKFRGHVFLRASGAPGVGKGTALLVSTRVLAVFGLRESESTVIRFRTTVIWLRNYREFGGDRRGNGRIFASFYEGFGRFRPPGVRKYRDSIPNCRDMASKLPWIRRTGTLGFKPHAWFSRLFPFHRDLTHGGIAARCLSCPELARARPGWPDLSWPSQAWPGLA